MEYTTSTYEHQYQYSSEQCVSAVLETYAPVHAASLLLNSFGMASVELLVPAFDAWIRQYHEYSCARATENALHLAFDVPTLQGQWLAGALSASSSIPSSSGSPLSTVNQAQLLLERAFTSLLGILVVALTFGLAAPLTVGGPACLSACCVMVHHAFLLGKLAVHFPAEAASPQLYGCYDAPKTTGVMIGVVALLVWAGSTAGKTGGYAAMARGAGVAAGVMVLVVLGGLLAVRFAKEKCRVPEIQLADGMQMTVTNPIGDAFSAPRSQATPLPAAAFTSLGGQHGTMKEAAESPIVNQIDVF